MSHVRLFGGGDNRAKFLVGIGFGIAGGFSPDEVEAIREYANRIEPINTDIRQLGLFNAERKV